MPRKRYRPEEIIAELREAEVLLPQGPKVPEVVKALGIHGVTYYRWRKEYGGMRVFREGIRGNRLRQVTIDENICHERLMHDSCFAGDRHALLLFVAKCAMSVPWNQVVVSTVTCAPQDARPDPGFLDDALGGTEGAEPG